MSIKSVTVSGRIFGKHSVLELFPDSTNKSGTSVLTNWVTVFGRNGSGKTTLSHAFWNLSSLGMLYSRDPDPNADINLQFVQSLPTRADNIFVFNEDFTDHIRFGSNELGAIVMLGPQGMLKDEIEQATKDNAELEQRIDEHNFQLGKDLLYGTQLDTGQETAQNRLEKNRREIERAFRDKVWAETARKIKGNRRNEPVIFDDLQRLHSTLVSQGKLIADADIPERRRTLDAAIAEFLELKDSTEIDSIWVDDAPDCATSDINDIQKWLGSIPIVDALPKDDIISVLQSGQQDISAGATQTYLQTEPDRCKLCLQPIDHKWVDKVLSAIEQVNRQSVIEDLKQKLHAAQQRIDSEIRRVDITVPESYESAHILLENDKEAVGDYLAALREVTSKIAEKADRPMASISLPMIDNEADAGTNANVTTVLTAQARFFKAVKAMNERIVSHNQSVNEAKAHGKQLLDENTLVEISDNAALFTEHENMQRTVDQFQTEVDELIPEHTTAQQHIATLQARQRQTKIAMENINASLRLVFLSSTRLVLEPKKGYYAVTVNGKPVPLSQLSAGEKNAIALAYFFAQPLSNKTSKPVFDDDLLFVIDDPITSLDRDNAIGIYSMIERECIFFKDCMVQNGKNLQVCILTHSLSAFTTFNRIADKLVKHRHSALQLASGCISPASEVKLNYRRLISDAYRFAKTDIESSSPGDESKALEINYESVGNQLRRALEEYSYFNFDVGQTGLFNSKPLQDRLEEEVNEGRLGPHTFAMIKGTLFHLWLNASSHGEDSAKSSDYYDHQVTLIDATQAVKTARLIMILLSIIHYTGLAGLLNSAPPASLVTESNQYIEQWESDFEGTTDSL